MSMHPEPVALLFLKILPATYPGVVAADKHVVAPPPNNSGYQYVISYTAEASLQDVQAWYNDVLSQQGWERDSAYSDAVTSTYGYHHQTMDIPHVGSNVQLEITQGLGQTVNVQLTASGSDVDSYAAKQGYTVP